MVKILIADDHKIVIDGLRSILEQFDEYLIVGEATNGNEVLEQMQIKPFDLAILDINMPILDGIETTKILMEKHPGVKILILSMYKNPSFIKRLVSAGAHGFILKNTSKNELIKAITCIMQDKNYYGEEVTQTLLNSFRDQEKNIIKITDREQEVLQLLADGMKTSEIAEMLFISSHTVESHRKNLLSKFYVNNTPSLLNKAINMGIINFGDNF